MSSISRAAASLALRKPVETTVSLLLEAMLQTVFLLAESESNEDDVFDSEANEDATKPELKRKGRRETSSAEDDRA